MLRFVGPAVACPVCRVAVRTIAAAHTPSHLVPELHLGSRHCPSFERPLGMSCCAKSPSIRLSSVAARRNPHRLVRSRPSARAASQTVTHIGFLNERSVMHLLLCKDMSKSHQRTPLRQLVDMCMFTCIDQRERSHESHRGLLRQPSEFTSFRDDLMMFMSREHLVLMSSSVCCD